MGLAGIIPFLQNLIQQPPPAGSAPAPAPDGSGQVVDTPDQPNKLPNAAMMPSFLANMQNPQGPPAPPPPALDPQPNLSADPTRTAAPAQAPGNPLDDLTATPTDAQGAPKLAPETKGHALLRILTSSVRGALDGEAGNAQTYAATGRNAGFGGGYQAATMLPMERALTQSQVARAGLENQTLAQTLPFLRAQKIADLYKTQSEVGKNTAAANKDTAEAAALPARQQLETAQAEAANYKEDPNLGLIDLRTKQPVSSTGQVPITDPDIAAILGKKVGDSVPLKLANTADEMKNRGIKSVSANGHSLLVDNKGNTIKDMGVATPMAVINATNPMSGAPGAPTQQPTAPGQPPAAPPTGEASLKGMTGNQATIIRGIATYDLDAKRYMTPRNAAAGAQLMAAVRAYNPSYDDTAFTEKHQLRTDIATQSQAFNTATHHLDMLNQAIDALNNHNMTALNAIGNSYHQQMGDDEVNNFNTIKEAVVGELSKIFKGGAATDKEIANQQANLSSSSSPRILKGAVGKYINLMQGRLDGLEETYEGQMGMKPNFQIVSPRTQQILSRYSNGGSQDAGSNMPPIASGFTRFQDSQGQMHDIPSSNLTKARERDPKLSVIGSK